MALFYAHVQILRDGELMLQRHLAGTVVVGPSASASIPLPGLDHDLELLSETPGGFTLRMPSGVSGKLRASDRILRVEDGLLHDPRPEPLLFADGDRGALWLAGGHLQIRFAVVRRAELGWRPRVDRSLALSLLSTAILLFGGATLVTRYGARPRSEETSLLRLRPAIVQSVLKLEKERRARVKAPPKTLERLAGRTALPAQRSPRRRAKSSRTRRRQRISSRLQRALKASHRLLTASSAAPLALAQLVPSDGTRSTKGLSAALRNLDSRAIPKLAPPALPPPAHRRLAAVKKSSRGATPTKRAVRNAVARHKGEVRLCYERALLSHRAPPEGRLLLRWRIDAKGKPSEIRVVRDGPGAPSLTRCIIQRLRAWTFPPCGGATCEVIYPFEFFSQT